MMRWMNLRNSIIKDNVGLGELESSLPNYINYLVKIILVMKGNYYGTKDETIYF